MRASNSVLVTFLSVRLVTVTKQKQLRFALFRNTLTFCHRVRRLVAQFYGPALRIARHVPVVRRMDFVLYGCGYRCVSGAALDSGTNKNNMTFRLFERATVELLRSSFTDHFREFSVTAVVRQGTVFALITGCRRERTGFTPRTC